MQGNMRMTSLGSGSKRMSRDGYGPWLANYEISSTKLNVNVALKFSSFLVCKSTCEGARW